MDVGRAVSVLDDPRRGLVATGSGGSLVVARLLAGLRRRSGGVAVAVSPLELRATGVPDEAIVLVVSAAGTNVDVQAAWDEVERRGPGPVVVLLGDPRSPLGARVGARGDVAWLDFPRTGTEGFVACGSALSAAAVGARALGARLPPTLPALLEPLTAGAEPSGWLEERTAALWERAHLVVLHDATTAAAAWDLESKFTEAAIGTIGIGDLRDFAHGRYHWVERHGEQTGLLVLASEATTDLARATTDLVERHATTVHLEIPGLDAAASLRALVVALQLTSIAARRRGVSDPARGGEHPFGPALHSLDVTSRRSAFPSSHRPD